MNNIIYIYIYIGISDTRLHEHIGIRDTRLHEHIGIRDTRLHEQSSGFAMHQVYRSVIGFCIKSVAYRMNYPHLDVSWALDFARELDEFTENFNQHEARNMQ